MSGSPISGVSGPKPRSSPPQRRSTNSSVKDRVVLCGVVEMELYQGLRENERELLEAQFSALAFFETSREDFRRAGHLLGKLRRQGVTIPSPDAFDRRALLASRSDAP